MKSICIFFGKPGGYLYLMLIWMFPFIFRDLNFFKSYDIDVTLPILNIYLIPFALCIFFVLTLNVIENLKNYWKTMKYRIKYLVVLGSYSSIMLFSGILTEILHDLGYVEYVGDVYGTIIMAYWPSVLLFWLIGIPVTMFLYAHAKNRERINN